MSARLQEYLAKDLDAKCQAIATILAGVEATHQAALLATIVERIVVHSEQIQRESAARLSTVSPPEPVIPTPEILEWARNQFTEEEAIAGLREIRQTGGLKFAQVIQGLESPPDDG